MKIVQFMTRKSVIHDFWACSSEIVKLLSFYAILSLHCAFRNVSPRITERGLHMLKLKSNFNTIIYKNIMHKNIKYVTLTESSSSHCLLRLRGGLEEKGENYMMSVSSRSDADDDSS